MLNLKNKIDCLFKSDIGQKIYADAERAIADFEMTNLISGGVLVGFSGGPDSVMLLCVLLQYAQNHKDFGIVAVHINHLIRGDEAFRDENFAKDFCNELGVEFKSVNIDIPSISKSIGKGLEETARNERYKTFSEILSGRNDLSAIGIAHNSTDNFETVLLNMMRGSGVRGLCGILPVRDNIIRPLIYVSKAEIMQALSENEIPCVIDSTNSSIEYNRNYVRNEIVPKFSYLSHEPERAITKLTDNLRVDCDYIESVVEDFFKNNVSSGVVNEKDLSSLHSAIRSRVILRLSKEASGISCEKNHVTKISSLLGTGDFSVSLPGKVSFISEKGKCSVGILKNARNTSFSLPLHIGINSIPGISGVIILSKEPFNKTFSNVYKISIQRAIPFDIIKGDLYLRSKVDGDEYISGGIHRKLKKLFNDKKIPNSQRGLVPVICDDLGILWVIGFGIRDGGANNKTQDNLYIALAYDTSLSDDNLDKLYSVNEF